MPDLTLAQQVNLGVALANQGRLDEAIVAYRTALAKWPNVAEAHFNLANALKEKRLFNDAIAAYRRALALRPTFPEAHNNLGNALVAQGRDDLAIAEYRGAISLRSTYAQAHYNLANSLCAIGEADAGIAAFRRALELEPNHADAANNLATALEDQHRLDDALALRRRVIQLRPDWPQGHINLSNLLQAFGEADEAIASAKRALELKPADAEGRMHIACALLCRGDLRAGFALYEARWETKDFTAKQGGFAQPLWDGSDPRGRRILLRDEQGLGDAIQFVRYAKVLTDHGATVIAQVKPPLRRLLENQCGLHQIFTPQVPLPTFDMHIPLMSLPHVMDTTLETIPCDVPYLMPDPQLAEHWHTRVRQQPGRLRVGLAWAGNPSHKLDRRRSLHLSALTELGKLPDITFYSLQKGPTAQQMQSVSFGPPFVDWTTELSDFADTAALIANLDLVIACDTAVAHLAGAMGKPVWVLLHYAPDWRWMRDRSDSPWYPSMRLFRQQEPGNWKTPVWEMIHELRSLASL